MHSEKQEALEEGCEREVKMKKQCCALFIVSLCSRCLSERSIKVDLVGFVSVVVAVRVGTVSSVTGILLFLGEVSV